MIAVDWVQIDDINFKCPVHTFQTAKAFVILVSLQLEASLRYFKVVLKDRSLIAEEQRISDRNQPSNET